MSSSLEALEEKWLLPDTMNDRTEITGMPSWSSRSGPPALAHEKFFADQRGLLARGGRQASRLEHSRLG